MGDELIQIGNRANAQAFINQENVRLGFPRVGVDSKTGLPQPNKTRTETYAEIIPHPSNNSVLINIDERVNRQGRNIISIDQALTRGFFPGKTKKDFPTRGGPPITPPGRT